MKKKKLIKIIIAVAVVIAVITIAIVISEIVSYNNMVSIIGEPAGPTKIIVAK